MFFSSTGAVEETSCGEPGKTFIWLVAAKNTMKNTVPMNGITSDNWLCFSQICGQDERLGVTKLSMKKICTNIQGQEECSYLKPMSTCCFLARSNGLIRVAIPLYLLKSKNLGIDAKVEFCCWPNFTLGHSNWWSSITKFDWTAKLSQEKFYLKRKIDEHHTNVSYSVKWWCSSPRWNRNRFQYWIFEPLNNNSAQC